MLNCFASMHASLRIVMSVVNVIEQNICVLQNVAQLVNVFDHRCPLIFIYIFRRPQWKYYKWNSAVFDLMY